MSEPGLQAGPFQASGGFNGRSLPRSFEGAWRYWAAPATGWLPLLVLVAVLGFISAALYYPGQLSNDSVYQYAEAVNGHYSDWHPPIMAWLFSVLLHVGEGPAPLFVLHLICYWSGFWLLADAVRRNGQPRTALLIALTGAFPPFVFLNGVVGKDVGMVAAWLPAIGMLFWYRSQGRRVPILVGVLVAALIAYGALVRTNAVFALGPLLLYALAPPGWLRSGRLVVGALLISVVAIPVSEMTNRVLFHPMQRQAIDSLFLFDLVGIAAYERNPALVEPRATVTLQDLKTCYSTFWWDSFSPWGRCPQLAHRPDTDHATYHDGLTRQWLETIRDHPLAYAVHRLKHFNSALIFAVPLKHMRFAPEYRADDPNHPPVEVFSPGNIRFDLIRKNPSVWPVTWFVWAGVLLVWLARVPASPAVLLARCLSVSTLGYSGAYLVVSVATDMRYHYWSIAAAMIATLLVLPQLAEGWRSRSRTLLAGLAVLAVVILIGLVTRLTDFQAWLS